MKVTGLCSLIILLCFSVGTQTGQSAQKVDDIDPCSLIASENVFAAFPILLKMEKKKTGPMTMCNYLNKYDIPALITSVTRAPKNVSDPLSILGDGYTIEAVSGLGDEATIAVQQPNPKYGLKAGVAALHIINGKRSLNISIFGLEILPGDPDFEQMKLLAAEMLKNL